MLYAQRCCHCILGADLLSAAGSCRAACVFISTHSPPPLNRVWALHSFLLLLNAAHTVRPLPPRSLFFPPILPSLTLFHPSRVTPAPLTPPRSTQSTAFISFLLPFRAYFASLERRCAFYALSAPDPSLNQNREDTLELAECFPML